MLIFKNFFKTQSDQNIHQYAPNCTIISQGELAYAPEPPSIIMHATIIISISA